MLFGHPEKQNEDFSGRVDEIFKQIGLTPTMELCRVGKTGNETRTRPLKVNLSYSSTARPRAVFKCGTYTCDSALFYKPRIYSHYL